MAAIPGEVNRAAFGVRCESQFRLAHLNVDVEEGSGKGTIELHTRFGRDSDIEEWCFGRIDAEPGILHPQPLREGLIFRVQRYIESGDVDGNSVTHQDR